MIYEVNESKIQNSCAIDCHVPLVSYGASLLQESYIIWMFTEHFSFGFLCSFSGQVGTVILKILTMCESFSNWRRTRNRIGLIYSQYVVALTVAWANVWCLLTALGVLIFKFTEKSIRFHEEVICLFSCEKKFWFFIFYFLLFSP